MDIAVMEQSRRAMLRQKIIQAGATRIYCIETKMIPLTWKAVMLCLDCKVAKTPWMRRWSCPPYALTPDAIKKMSLSYPSAFVVNVEVELFALINRSWDSFDPLLQVMQKLYCHFYWSRLHKIMLSIKGWLTQESIAHYVWGSSPCHACFKCSYPMPCRSPSSFLMSPEASGIDLYRLAQLVGIPIEIPPRRKVQLMSVALMEN